MATDVSSYRCFFCLGRSRVFNELSRATDGAIFAEHGAGTAIKYQDIDRCFKCLRHLLVASVGLPLLILILLASIIRNGALARYFSLMHKTDIPVLDAIEICEKIVANRVIADALSRAHAMINAGNSMSESFRNAGLFPALVVRMINVGESTGALDKSLLNISYFYDRDVNAAMQKVLKIIEPLLTLILGAILAFIMFSVLGPVYDSFSKLKL
jgi:type II secretory pathway component PulF